MNRVLSCVEESVVVSRLESVDRMTAARDGESAQDGSGGGGGIFGGGSGGLIGNVIERRAPMAMNQGGVTERAATERSGFPVARHRSTYMSSFARKAAAAAAASASSASSETSDAAASRSGSGSAAMLSGESLAGMTPGSVDEAVRELRSRFGDKRIDFLKERGRRRENRGGNDDALEAAAKGERTKEDSYLERNASQFSHTTRIEAAADAVPVGKARQSKPKANTARDGHASPSNTTTTSGREKKEDSDEYDDYEMVPRFGVEGERIVTMTPATRAANTANDATSRDTPDASVSIAAAAAARVAARMEAFYVDPEHTEDSLSFDEALHMTRHAAPVLRVAGLRVIESVLRQNRIPQQAPLKDDDGDASGKGKDTSEVDPYTFNMRIKALVRMPKKGVGSSRPKTFLARRGGGNNDDDDTDSNDDAIIVALADVLSASVHGEHHETALAAATAAIRLAFHELDTDSAVMAASVLGMHDTVPARKLYRRNGGGGGGSMRWHADDTELAALMLRPERRLLASLVKESKQDARQPTHGSTWKHQPKLDIDITLDVLIAAARRGMDGEDGARSAARESINLLCSEQIRELFHYSGDGGGYDTSVAQTRTKLLCLRLVHALSNALPPSQWILNTSSETQEAIAALVLAPLAGPVLVRASDIVVGAVSHDTRTPSTALVCESVRVWRSITVRGLVLPCEFDAIASTVWEEMRACASLPRQESHEELAVAKESFLLVAMMVECARDPSVSGRGGGDDTAQDEGEQPGPQVSWSAAMRVKALAEDRLERESKATSIAKTWKPSHLGCTAAAIHVVVVMYKTALKKCAMTGSDSIMLIAKGSVLSCALVLFCGQSEAFWIDMLSCRTKETGEEHGLSSSSSIYDSFFACCAFFREFVHLALVVGDARKRVQSGRDDSIVVDASDEDFATLSKATNDAVYVILSVALRAAALQMPSEVTDAKQDLSTFDHDMMQRRVALGDIIHVALSSAMQHLECNVDDELSIEHATTLVDAALILPTLLPRPGRSKSTTSSGPHATMISFHVLTNRKILLRLTNACSSAMSLAADASARAHTCMHLCSTSAQVSAESEGSDVHAALVTTPTELVSISSALFWKVLGLDDDDAKSPTRRPRGESDGTSGDDGEIPVCISLPPAFVERSGMCRSIEGSNGPAMMSWFLSSAMEYVSSPMSHEVNVTDGQGDKRIIHSESEMSTLVHRFFLSFLLGLFTTHSLYLEAIGVSGLLRELVLSYTRPGAVTENLMYDAKVRVLQAALSSLAFDAFQTQKLTLDIDATDVDELAATFGSVSYGDALMGWHIAALLARQPYTILPSHMQLLLLQNLASNDALTLLVTADDAPGGLETFAPQRVDCGDGDDADDESNSWNEGVVDIVVRNLPALCRHLRKQMSPPPFTTSSLPVTMSVLRMSISQYLFSSDAPVGDEPRCKSGAAAAAAAVDDDATHRLLRAAAIRKLVRHVMRSCGPDDAKLMFHYLFQRSVIEEGVAGAHVLPTIREACEGAADLTSAVTCIEAIFRDAR